jgi:hypothetical protein
MSLRLGSPDSLPYVCAVYVCSACGGALTRHGRDCGEPPAGWVEAGGEGQAGTDYVCPGCAPEASAGSDR